MKSRLLLFMATAVLLAGILAGCAGISQQTYDAAKAQLDASQAKIAELQTEIASKAAALEAQNKAAKAQTEAAQAQMQAAQAQAASLQSQIAALKKQYELAGKTPAETAANVVRLYHETHVYSVYDLFVCGDMSAEVWNMLKAQGIKAVIVVGNIDTAIGDILQSDHAWVLAEVSPGEYLALETTGGFVVTRSENALYYRGWTFSSPADIKRQNDLVKEYNVRVSIRNEINNKVNEVIREHDRSTSQAEADKLQAVIDRLVELRKSQETELGKVKAEIDSLATGL